MKRGGYVATLRAALEAFPVVALLGPRQVGKTTLAREAAAEAGVPRANYFDLESASDLARLAEPELALGRLTGLVVIDEVQRHAELFTTLRVLVDRPNNSARFLILGSASRDLLRQSSESLAGRIKYLHIHPFSLGEVGADSRDQLWLRGGYPRAFLAPHEAGAFDWLDQYVRTFLERDIPQLGFNVPAPTVRRFWMMLTHYHGQVFNRAEIARALDIGETSVRRYLDILAGTFMIRLLTPWHANIGKREIKSPKLYFRDSGLFHNLSGITSDAALQINPRFGASWEGFALEEVLRWRGAHADDVFFWGVHAQSELDLLLRDGPDWIGYEFKYSLRPTLTKSMQAAIDTLQLKKLEIIYPGEVAFPLSNKVAAIPLATLCTRPG